MLETSQAMRRFALGVCLILAMAGSSGARQNATTPRLPQTDTDIAGAIGNDVEARALISNELTHLRPFGGRVLVLSRQIRVEWLPKVEGVEFVRLSDADAAKLLTSCGTYWVIAAAVTDRGRLRISTNEQCNASTHGTDFERRDGEWRPAGTGVGAGFVGGPPAECLPCLTR